MARAIEEIERDIRRLSPDEKETLCLQLMAELEVVPPELEVLAKEFSSATESTLDALQSAANSLDSLDERLATARRILRA